MIKRWTKPHKVWIPSKHGEWCKSSDVAELEKEIAGYKYLINEQGEYIKNMQEENGRLKAENEALRKHLEGAMCCWKDGTDIAKKWNEEHERILCNTDS